ncbi:MAG: membrane protein insertase YidC [Ruminococcus sp.]|nr:membrane protein insertase YidC [Ruminococcus sp.]
MSIIYSLFGNYAVSIIVFTVVTKLLLFPVNYKTQKSAARMQLLNPKLEKLKKSYSTNPERLQQEQQKLYQEEGVNPMASCLPALIQMILLFGVIDVVYKPITHILRISKSVISAAVDVASGLADKPFNVKNLRCELLTMEQLDKNPDAFTNIAENFRDVVSEFSSKFTLFGANLGKTPEFHPDTWNRESIILFIIPFAAGLAQLLSSVYSQMHQKKVNPNMQNMGCMSAMMYLMPIWSIWLAFTLPAGIGFYWIWSSLFSFLITFGLNQYFTPERTAVINEKEKQKMKEYAEKHPEKKTFMQRLMEQAEMQQQTGGNDGEKVSRSESNKQNRDRIAEARKRMAEKYGDEYDENDSD